MAIKTNIYLGFFILFFFHVRGQYSIAGWQGGIYVDIVPDTLLNPVPNSWSAETYSVDLNQDGLKDVELKAYSGYSPGGSAVSCSVTSIDTSFKLSFLRYDSSQYSPNCGANWFIYATMLKPYLAGDTIKAGPFVNGGSLTKSGNSLNCYSYGDYLWVKNYDQFIGVKQNATAGVQFGWIRVSVTGGAVMTIKDHSLGNTIVGIDLYDSKTIRIFPNPANSHVHIKGENIESVRVMDLCGKQILSTKDVFINAEILESGIYFISIATPLGQLIHKLIIQH